MEWDSVWIDGAGEVWGYPYFGDGYLGLGKIDNPWSEAEIVARNGGPLRRLVPEEGQSQ